ncbi:MAG: hypothetical protein U9P73_08900 [Candidatus Cloacimonadota bacterium]|nr:hypothetical protein [Candidatus Cloacimonadota bacterium]
MSEYTPVEHLTKIQKLKYRAAFFPILLVIISFVLNMIYGIDQTKYLSIFGFIWYLIIIIQFRVRRNYPPESKTEIALSPIYGKVSKIEDRSITIKKGFFQSADIRYAGQNIEVTIRSKQAKYFEDQPSLAGRLIGVISSSGICICGIPEGWKIELNVGDKVTAGESILAVK